MLDSFVRRLLKEVPFIPVPVPGEDPFALSNQRTVVKPNARDLTNQPAKRPHRASRRR
jgi:hypothetical protein